MSVNDIILLNVGGKKFETSRQTLLSDPQSMLGPFSCQILPVPSNLDAFTAKLKVGDTNYGHFFSQWPSGSVFGIRIQI